jgi:hypothetical protein
MAHLFVASLAAGALLAVIAFVMVLQRERPRLRRAGLFILLGLLALAALVPVPA